MLQNHLCFTVALYWKNLSKHSNIHDLYTCLKAGVVRYSIYDLEHCIWKDLTKAEPVNQLFFPPGKWNKTLCSDWVLCCPSEEQLITLKKKKKYLVQVSTTITAAVTSLWWPCTITFGAMVRGMADLLQGQEEAWCNSRAWSMKVCICYIL